MPIVKLIQRLTNRRPHRLAKSDRASQRLSAATQPITTERLEQRTLLSSYDFATLVFFNNTNGGLPNGDLVADSSGNLFGTTGTFNNQGNGSVFELAAGTHSLSTIIKLNGSDGGEP